MLGPSIIVHARSPRCSSTSASVPLRSVVAVIAMVIVLRVNAFIALIGAALLVSLLAPGPLGEKAARVAGAFGSVCGGIGIVIALAVAAFGDADWLLPASGDPA